MKYSVRSAQLTVAALMILIQFVAAPRTAAASVVIGQNFTSTTFGSNSDLSPADANGAVGPQHFVELVNGRFSVYLKATGQRVQSKTALQFWSAAGVKLASTLSVSDPRIAFDSYSQRWFASMVDFTINTVVQRSNRFRLAVSGNSDPTGLWHGFAFAADPKGVSFADFPTLGIDQHAVYLAADMFDRSGDRANSTLVEIPMTGLLSDPPTIVNRRAFETLSYSARGSILQPAITMGKATTAEMIAAVGDLGVDGQPHTLITLFSLLEAGTSSVALSNPSTSLTVPAYTVPAQPLQPDGQSHLNNGDARFSSSVRRVGDILYATHAVEVSQRSAVGWYRINAGDSTLIESGLITDPDLDLFYPSIAANPYGRVVIGCNGSSRSTFVSSYAIVGETVNGKLTFGRLALLKAGTASYSQPDSTGSSRWGDYSATSLDPADSNRFWTIQMVAVSRSAWATQVTELITSTNSEPVPNLAISSAGTNLVISWVPQNAAFQLQRATHLRPEADWTDLGLTPSSTNQLQSIGLPPSGAEGFFRLTSVPTP